MREIAVAEAGARESRLRGQHRGFLGHPCGKVLVCYLVAATAFLGALPQEGLAALAPTALPAAERGTGRAEDLARLQSLLEQKVVAQRLAELGFSAEEIRARLEALDDQRLREVAQRVDGLVPAGQAVEGLAAALVVAFYLVAAVVVGFFYLVSWIVRSASAPKSPTGEVAPADLPPPAPETPTGEDAETTCVPGSFLYRCIPYVEEGEAEPGRSAP